MASRNCLLVTMVRFEEDAFMEKTLLDNFNNDVASDVTIVLENGDRIHCHKLVLLMGSPVFGTTFHESMDETTGAEVQIDGQPNAVECMLRFLYSGQCELNNENIAAVTALAESFDIQNLNRCCLEYMKNYMEVNSQNCVQLLESGYEEKVTKVFVMAANYIFETGKWDTPKGLSYGLMEAFVQQAKQHRGSQINVVRFIKSWMNGFISNSYGKGITLLMRVDLGTLSFPELSEVCSMAVVQETEDLQVAVVKAISLKQPGVCWTPHYWQWPRTI